MEPTRHDNTGGRADPGFERALSLYWQRLDEADGAPPAEIHRQIIAEFPEFARELRGMFAAEAGLAAKGSSRSEPTTASPDDTCESVLEKLTSSGLVNQRQAEKIQSAITAGQVKQPQQLLDELLKRKLITRWQLEELTSGRTEFLLENGRYLLLQKIGQGGMGAVYRARHVRMKRDVALKIIDPRRADDTALMDRFRREAEVCARLEHEHIVQTHDVGEHNGSLFLAMEYVEGSDLASLVRRDGPMSPGEVAAVGLQMAAALAYAHAQGIVHRDIKPSNTLLSTSGSCKVLDMGLARIVEDATDATITELTQDGTVMGTVDYMSPEQARDSHSVDARTDIYSLGASLYFLLTGRPPFPGGKTIEKLHRLATEEPQPLGQIRPDCPRELDLAIQQMMAKSPEDRFQSAEDVVRALKPLAADRLAGRPVVTTAVQTAAETHRKTFYQAQADTLPDFAADASVFSTIQRRRGGVSKFWWIGGTAVVSACLVLAIWSASASRPKPTEDPDEPIAAAPVPVPPADVRVEFPGHFGGVTALAWSPNGQWLASGGADGLCRVWNPINGSIQAVYRGHHSAIYALAWSDDSKVIASGEFLNEIHVWDFSGTRLCDPIPTDGEYSANAQNWQQAIDFSPDGRHLAFGAAGGNKVGVYDIDEDRHVWTSDVDFGYIVRFSPDGRLLAAATKDVVVLTADTGDRVFASPPDVDRNTVAWRENGSLMISTETALNTWDLDAGRIVESIELPTLIRGNHMLCSLIFWSGSKRKCLVFDDEAKRFLTLDVESGERIHVGQSGKIPTLGSGLVCRPDLRQIADSGINVRNPDDWSVETALAPTLLLPECRGVEVLQDRYLQIFLRVGTYPGYVATWDLHTGELVHEFPAAAHVDNEGKIRGVVNSRIVSFRRQGNRAVTEGNPIATLTPPALPTNTHFPAVRWSEDGTHVYSDNRFLASTEFRLWDASTGQLETSFDFADGLGNDDDRYKNMQYYDGNSAANAQCLDVGPVLMGDSVLYRPGWGVRDPSNVVRIWQPPWTQPPLEVPLKLDEEITTQVRVSHNGQFLATNGSGQLHPNGVSTSIVFDLQTGRRVADLHTGIPHLPVSYDFSLDDRYLLTTHQVWDWEQKLKLWECPQRDQAFGYVHTNYRGAAMFDDGEHVVLARDGQYQIWNWQANNGEGKMRATLFLTPEEGGYAFYNHETGHWTGEAAARQYLQFAALNEDGETEWLSPFEYEQRIGWENDRSHAGLELQPEWAVPPQGT